MITTTEQYENTEATESLLWDDKNFLDWFLQSKFKQIKLDDGKYIVILDFVSLFCNHVMEILNLMGEKKTSSPKLSGKEMFMHHQSF